MGDPLAVDLTRVPPRGLTVDLRLSPGVFTPEDTDLRPAGDVRLRGTLRRSGVGWEVRGRIEAVLVFRCGRCLMPFPHEIRTDFVTTYRPRPDRFEEEVQIRKEDLSLSYLEGEGDRLHWGEIAREELLLQVPMKPLCSPDCPGLCPTCGAPAGARECACPPPSTDPRLADLADIRERMKH
jgi:uncharacterized protein